MSDKVAARWTANKAFCTFGKVSDERIDHNDICSVLRTVHGDTLKGALIARELHADTIVDGVTIPGLPHYHAAIFGDFKKRGAEFTKFNRICSGYEFPSGAKLPVGNNNMQFSHPNAPNKPWPFGGGSDSMTGYLTKPKKDKVVDTHPLIVYWDTDDQRITCTLDDLHMEYNRQYPAAISLAGRAKLVRQMKEDGANKDDVIEVLINDMTKDNSYQFGPLMELFKAVPRIETVNELRKVTPRPGQALCRDAICAPLDPTNNRNRGIWLHSKPGWGKSLMYNIIAQEIGEDKIFIPAERNDSYSTMSMIGYNNEPVIFMDDTRGYTDGSGVAHHKGNFIKFIKAIATGDIMKYTMYNQVHTFRPYARVLITSNYAMPVSHEDDDNEALKQRYTEISSDDINKIAQQLKLPLDLGTNTAGTALQGVMPVVAPHTASNPSTPLRLAPAGNQQVDITSSGNNRPRARRRLFESDVEVMDLTQSPQPNDDEDDIDEPVVDIADQEQSEETDLLCYSDSM